MVLAYVISVIVTFLYLCTILMSQVRYGYREFKFIDILWAAFFAIIPIVNILILLSTIDYEWLSRWNPIPRMENAITNWIRK